MTRRVFRLLSLSLALTAMPSAQTAEGLDHATIAQIRDEGLSRSQVMDHIGWLADVYGPRLTGAPGIQQVQQRDFPCKLTLVGGEVVLAVDLHPDDVGRRRAVGASGPRARKTDQRLHLRLDHRHVEPHE
jgi:hypothetical protein